MPAASYPCTRLLLRDKNADAKQNKKGGGRTRRCRLTPWTHNYDGSVGTEA